MRIGARGVHRAGVVALAATGILILATCDLSTLVDATSPTHKTIDSTALTLTGADNLTLGGTGTLAISSPTAALTDAVVRFGSAASDIVSIDSISGAYTGVAIGTARLTARVLAPELGSGISISQDVRVRYKGVKLTSPVAGDSIEGSGQTRTIMLRGLNVSDQLQATALTPDSLRSKDTTVFVISGGSARARKTGTAFLLAFFDNLRDSVAVRVRQVAKSISFPTTDFTATAVNVNFSVPVVVRDVADSVISAPTLTWRTRDTTTAVVSAAGILRLKKASSDSVWAKMDTVERGQKVVVRQIAASLAKFAGDTQVSAVATSVATAPTVTVLDAGATPIAGDTVVFRVVQGVNAVVQDTLQLTDANGHAKPTSWKLGDVAGTNTIVAQSKAVPALTRSFTATGVPGPARRLAFIAQPGTGAVGAVLNPALQVEIQDSLGNRVTLATDNITIDIGNNPGSAALGGTVSAAAVAGVATFSDITVSASGAGYTLLASSSGLDNGTSNAFDAFGAAAKLAFFSVPSSAAVGVPVSPPVRVVVQDANGVIVRTSAAAVTVTASTVPATGVMTCSCSGAAVNGVVSFAPAFNAPGTWALSASSSGLTPATSSTITVAGVGAAAKLAFAVNPPTSTVSKAILSPALTVQVQDANGSLVTSSSQSITLSLDPAGPSGATLTGSTTVAAVSGIATFSSLSVDKADTGYKLIATATGSGLTQATSSSFAITVGPAAKLGFVQQPTNTIAGQAMSPPVTVAVQDAGGNRVSSSASIAVALSVCSGTLTGGGAVAASNGLASFAGLSVAGAATGCKLTASATGLTGATSTAFDIGSAASAVKLAFTSQPQNAVAGAALASFSVAVQNTAGGGATAASPLLIALSVVSGPGSVLGGASCTSTTGCTYSGASFSKAGTYRLEVSAAGLRPDTSAPFTISPATALRVAFVTPPSNVVAGTAFSPAVQAAVQDGFGNTVTSATNAVFITAGGKVNGSTVTLPFSSGATSVSVNAVAGVATFTGLAIKQAATNGVLTVSAAGLVGEGSGFFAITAGPASALGFVTQPSNVVIASSITPAVQVQAQDSVGNVVTDFINSITVSLTGGTAGAFLAGATTNAPTNGAVTFSNLNIDKIGTGYQLIASATSLPNATSNTFNVTAGPAAILTWTAPPVDATFAHAPLVGVSSAVTIEAQDATGHTATSFNGVVRVAATGPGSLLNNSSPVSFVDFTAVAGVVAIPTNQISLQTAGSYTFTASTPFAGLTAATTSNATTVAAFDSPAKLSWGNQPGNGTYDVIIPAVSAGMSPSVSVLDQYNNLVGDATNSVSVQIGNDPLGTTAITGNSAVAATSGSATFPSLRFDKAATGYTLTASSGGLTSATSAPFNITMPGIVGGVGSVQFATVVGTTLYYTKTNDGLASVPLIGGTATPITATSNPALITNDGANVYWAEFNTNTADAAIRKLNISSGTITTLVSGLTNLCAPGAGATTTLETDGVNVYFVSLIAAKYTIQSIPVGAVNGTATPLYTAPSGVPYFGLFGSFIYFKDDASNTIIRMTTAGGSPSTLTTSDVNGSGLYGFAMDGSTLLYFNFSRAYSITNAASASGPVAPDTVVSSTNTVNDVATNGGAVYVVVGSQVRKYASGNYSTFTTLTNAVSGFYRGHLFDTASLIYYAGNGTFEKVPK